MADNKSFKTRVGNRNSTKQVYNAASRRICTPEAFVKAANAVAYQMTQVGVTLRFNKLLQMASNLRRLILFRVRP
jgi:hypothetical protein